MNLASKSKQKLCRKICFLSIFCKSNHWNTFCFKHKRSYEVKL
ncbi:hypothetical protein CCS77_0468 [Campylobacter concisus]|uniref:Uncharacterized protein n=1 Tax=Campylobacter concisus TaxID=199 RepID=A0A2R4NYL8_9BACT|nr:hypothetical protein CCS77_0468 [Campylobacter concisus]